MPLRCFIEGFSYQLKNLPFFLLFVRITAPPDWTTPKLSTQVIILPKTENDESRPSNRQPPIGTL